MQKFLVIQTAFIGDVVLATALLEKLHACYPDAHLDFLVRKGNEALLAGHPYLHETLVWDKKQNKLRNLWRMTRRIRREKYEKVINVQRFAATGILTAFSGAKETIGFDKNPLSRFFTRRIPHVISAPVEPGRIPQGPAVHEVERNPALIAAFTDDRPARPRLYPTAADVQKVAGYKDRPYITISPASVWFTKQYPAEQWASFIRALSAVDAGGRLTAQIAAASGAGTSVMRDAVPLTVYLLGAPGDRRLGDGIMTMAATGNIVNLAGELSFLQSAALMQGAVMNYVNDSAPMHFASALNAPVTAVYCSTIPGFGFGPLSDNSHVVGIEAPLSCRPCGLHGYKACPQGHFNCARKIGDRQLLQTLPGIL
ncbi:MAG TPA: glycosyltransferase family 9 protein [Puia sp.]|nr:glycosyltransferase family 9 protein [Puia sp.]